MQNPSAKLNFIAIIFELVLYIIKNTYIELSPYIHQYIKRNSCRMPFLSGFLFFPRTNAVNDYCTLSRLSGMYC